MASLSELRSALATTLAAIDGLTVYEVVPESVNVPACIVSPRQTDFNRAFGRGVDGYTFDVIVLVSRRDDGLAQLDLDPFVTGAGSSSVREAVWNNRDLGLTGDADAFVSGMSEYGANFTVGSTDYVGARLTIEVITSGSS